MELPELPDEVSASDYVRACDTVRRCGMGLRLVTPDEAVEHWLPTLTEAIAVIFSFVGSNATMRHTAQLHHVAAAYERAKDG